MIYQKKKSNCHILKVILASKNLKLLINTKIIELKSTIKMWTFRLRNPTCAPRHLNTFQKHTIQILKANNISYSLNLISRTLKKKKKFNQPHLKYKHFHRLSCIVSYLFCFLCLSLLNTITGLLRGRLVTDWRAIGRWSTFTLHFGWWFLQAKEHMAQCRLNGSKWRSCRSCQHHCYLWEQLSCTVSFNDFTVVEKKFSDKPMYGTSNLQTEH